MIGIILKETLTDRMAVNGAKKGVWRIYCDKGRERPIEHMRELLQIGQKQTTPFAIKYGYIDMIEERLTSGDYAIAHVDDDGNEVIVCIVERKTWQDYADTIRNSDRAKNHGGLVELGKKNAYVCYIVEGQAPVMSPDILHTAPHGLKDINIIAKIDHISFRDNVRVIYTANEMETAVRLVVLCANMRTMYKKVAGAGENVSFKDVTRVKEDSDRDVAVRMLQCVPKVSMKSADAILSCFSLRELMSGNVSKKDLADTIRYGNNRRLPSSLIDKLHEYICNMDETKLIVILECIKGISKAKGLVIAAGRSYDQLYADKVAGMSARQHGMYKRALDYKKPE